MKNFRYPSEQIILGITFIVVIAVAILSAIPTSCLAPLLGLLIIVMSYFGNKAQHAQLIRSAEAITPQKSPEMAAIAQTCVDRIRPGAVQFFVVPSRQRNAYTFGLTKPNVVVIYSELLKIMDADEIRFVIGHELGHVTLDHTWLNTLLGGMAGVPASWGIAVIVTLVFRMWNRACEYSADRAGLLACGNINKAVSALVQLVVGDVRSQEEWQRALDAIDREDDSFGNQAGELLSSHPMIIKRINELRRWAVTEEYRRCQAQALSGK